MRVPSIILIDRQRLQAPCNKELEQFTGTKKYIFPIG
jgi:hypothetical protein